MTLVVARKIEGRIYLVGDTKFTPENPSGRDGQHHFIGGLKVVVLHPGAVVAFANNTFSAKRAIEGIHKRGVDLFDKKAVLDYFLDVHLRSLLPEFDAMVEFIVATILDDQSSELFLIKDGKVEFIEAGYIGDAVAYNAFLQYECQLTVNLEAQCPCALPCRLSTK